MKIQPVVEFNPDEHTGNTVVVYYAKMNSKELEILYALTGYSSSDSLKEASLKVLGTQPTCEDSYVLGDMFMVIEKAFNEPKGR